MTKQELLDFIDEKLSDLMDIQDRKMQGPEEHEARNEHINSMLFVSETLREIIKCEN